jgi:Nuclease-related domain
VGPVQFAGAWADGRAAPLEVWEDDVHSGVRAELQARHNAGLHKTAQALAELEHDGWLVLHDLQRPGRRFASIDHIAIGPGGIVVIDAKDWSGTVDVSGGVLRQNGSSRERETELAAACASAVTAWLEPAQRTAVMSVICLVWQPTPSGQPAGTAVYGVEDLAASLRALPVRLRTGEIWAVADLLRRTLAAGSVPIQLTTASLAAAIATASEQQAEADRPRQSDRSKQPKQSPQTGPSRRSRVPISWLPAFRRGRG